MRKILLIRHGATQMNTDDVSTDRLRGQKDVPLSAEGVKEAHRLGKKINKQNPKPDLMLSSDLSRAVDTAKAVCEESGCKYIGATKGYRPWALGKLTGMVTKKALPILDRYIRHPDQPIPSEKDGEHGESFNTFTGRFLDQLRETLEKYPDLYVAIVTHHRGEMFMKGWKAKGFPPDGSIDLKVFDQKGEGTGSAEDFEIPMAALERVQK